MSFFKGFLPNKRESFIQILLLAGIFILINILADRQILRLDVTDDKRYTLSESSKTIARELTDPVTITAYFSDDLPPQLERGKREFRNYLEEFRAYAGGNLEFRFINPTQSEDAEIRAQQSGIQPVLIDVRERDQISQKRAYLGAVFTYGEDSEIIPVIEPGTAMEYNIASAIKQISSPVRATVGVVQGHGQPSLNWMVELSNNLSQRYNLEEVLDFEEEGVPANIDVLLIIAPQTEFTEAELRAIDQYVMAGGNAVFALNRVEADLQTNRGNPVSTGLELLAAHYGVTVNENLVRDRNASTINVQQQQGGFTYMNQIDYPYIPVIYDFPDHPITAGLDGLIFQFVSSLQIALPDSGLQHTVLAESSELSGISEGNFDLNPFRDWTNRDFLEAHLPLAVLLEGNFKSAYADHLESVYAESVAPGSLVIIGDGNFIINGEGRAQQRLPRSNVNFMVNVVDWLADDTGLIALRNKIISNRPLDSIEDGTQTFLKYMNVFLPVLLITGYGFIRYRKRKSRRKRWLEKGI